MNRVAKVRTYDIANGEGIRTSIFFSGCEFQCKGCFNAHYWDFNNGDEFSIQFYETCVKSTINDHIRGISVLGGEPLHPKNIQATQALIGLFKRDFPDKDIWLWTGYTLEQLMSNEYMALLPSFDYIDLVLGQVDVLIDGQFIEEQKDLKLKWRGSKNQRVIDMQRSLKEHEVVLYDKL